MTPPAIRAIIVDDEELSRRLIVEYLSADPAIEVVHQCSNGFDAVKACADLKPGLLFLDVQMPKLDGFEVLELIDPTIAVVFVTAFDQYAMKAFDAAAVDYLLKPFNAERFRTALDRVRRRINENKLALPAADLALSARPPGVPLERIVVRDGTRVHIIPVAQLDYAEAQDDYIALHAAGKSYLKQQSLASLEMMLDSLRFVRVHRSYLVNLERVTKIEPYTKDTRLAILTGGVRIPISRAGYQRLKELMDGA